MFVSMYLKKTKIILCHTENIFLAGAFTITRSRAINSIKIILKCLHDNNTYIFLFILAIWRLSFLNLQFRNARVSND